MAIWFCYGCRNSGSHSSISAHAAARTRDCSINSWYSVRCDIGIFARRYRLRMSDSRFAAKTTRIFSSSRSVPGSVSVSLIY